MNADTADLTLRRLAGPSRRVGDTAFVAILRGAALRAAPQDEVICESLINESEYQVYLYLKVDGRMVYLWCAVDAEGEVLDVLVQPKRDQRAALKLNAAVYDTFNVQRHLTSASTHRSFRAAAMDTWRAAVA